MRIKVQPMWGAEPLMCSENVRKRIKALGGKAVYGWQIVQCGPHMISKNKHCVWQDEYGQLWDVTPMIKKVMDGAMMYEWPEEEAEFEPDDKAYFEAKPGHPPSGPHYATTKNCPHLRRAAACMTRADDAAWIKNDLEGYRYWTRKANDAVRRAGYPRCGWDIPTNVDREDMIAACCK